MLTKLLLDYLRQAIQWTVVGELSMYMKMGVEKIISWVKNKLK